MDVQNLVTSHTKFPLTVQCDVVIVTTRTHNPVLDGKMFGTGDGFPELVKTP